MKRPLEISQYVADVQRVANLSLPWDKLRGKNILITGGTGLIGSFLIDVLHATNLQGKLFLCGRSEERTKARFIEYWDEKWMTFIPWDATIGMLPTVDAPIDVMIHLASNTHPVAYATDPIGTIRANVNALDVLLDFASNKRCQRFLFASSNEIYGENRGDVEFFEEQYCGYIDCNTLRAGYPEAKRCGEALCQAYLHQKGLDCVIARLTRTYGPTVLSSDTKAINQFFKNVINGEDIVLKSAGTQYYSYQYVADSVSGLLTVLLCGETGEAYNVAHKSGDITLKDLAALIAQACGKTVVFDLPNEIEARGFSRATKARLDGSKLSRLGWNPHDDITTGIIKNCSILREFYV